MSEPEPIVTVTENEFCKVTVTKTFRDGEWVVSDVRVDAKQGIPMGVAEFVR